MNSILTSIKKLLGIAESDTSFDQVIIMHINSVLAILTQLGVGPASGFSISSNTDVWSDFIDDATNLELIKSYIYMKVRLMFDPPINSSVTESINKTVSELEWRINVTVDSSTTPNTADVVNQTNQNTAAINDLRECATLLGQASLRSTELFKTLAGEINE